MKVVTIVGTRPELIRLSCVISRLENLVDHKLVHTGQNYDYELNQVFFDDLGLREPDHFLGADTSSLGAALGSILVNVESVLRDEKPDAVLILGDTNSAIAGIIAKRMKIPLYHMEAGNRCFDLNVPEETNRRLVDHISDFNLVYTEHARRHLLAEGMPHRRIYLTGSPMKEVLAKYSSSIDASAVLSELGLEEKEYILVSVHREENVDSKASLTKIVDMLDRVSLRFDKDVVVSTHPRTRNRLNAIGLEGETRGRIKFLKPFGFNDYNRLQKSAFCVISDSGTISEESSILNFPAVTLRQSIERPEALDTGAILLTGHDPEVLELAIKSVTETAETGRKKNVPRDYEVANTSERVANLIIGTARLSNKWWGVERHDYN
jgi:UDP-N-acetylglucosamine 2-epimerase (non-hydrolysing)